MSWRIGDTGFEMRIDPRVPATLGIEAPAFVDQLLSAASLSRTDVRSWALHPGGRRILDALAEALDLDGPAVGPSLDVLRRAGNMSSGTVFFVIERLLREGGGAEPLVALGFGPGLTLEGAVLAPGYAPADPGFR